MSHRQHGPPTDDASPVDRLLDRRELVVASNREPYAHEYGDDGDVEVSRPAGGLTAALDPVIRSTGGTWVAWGSGDADRDVVDEHDRVAVPPEDPAYDLRRVWLDEDDLAGYYYGFSNRVLWPLCHSLPSKVDYEPEFWETYRRVNERFADAVVAECETTDPVVWLHDYHFGVAPRSLRRRLGREALLAHFWHVPWPSYDVFRRCPRARTLLTAMLNNDLVGFHTEGDRRRFVRCAEELVDATYDAETGRLRAGGRETVVRAAPIRIDADAVAERARSDAATSFRREFVADHGLEDVRVAVGVDRLDYTKGIPERLDALERLWAEHPEWRGELTYVQKATESRSRIDEYRDLQRRVESRVAAINERFGTDDWQPVVYLDEHVPEAALAGLYREADLALVSPVRDGLNLVAEEYVAAQDGDDGDGALVLSDAAGVARQFGEDAFTVRPMETDDFAETIRRALECPADERRERLRSLSAAVSDGDGAAWVRDLFGPVAASPTDVSDGEVCAVGD